MFKNKLSSVLLSSVFKLFILSLPFGISPISCAAQSSLPLPFLNSCAALPSSLQPLLPLSFYGSPRSTDVSPEFSFSVLSIYQYWMITPVFFSVKTGFLPSDYLSEAFLCFGYGYNAYVIQNLRMSGRSI